MLIEFRKLYTNKNFIRLWISQILSQITINILNFLILLKIYASTGSALATSLLWITYALPAILVGPIGATTIDFVSKRKMLVLTNLAQSATVLLMGFFHPERFYLLFAGVFIYSLLNQFYLPAEQSSVPELVDKKDLPLANGSFFITQQVAVILGFGIAGVLNRFLGFSNSIYLAAFMLFIAFVSVYFLPPMNPKLKLSGSFEDAIISFFRKLFEGYRFIKDNKQILYPFGMLIALQIVLAVVIVNVPVLATDVLKISLNLSGGLIVVPVGIGAVIGSVVIPSLLKKGMRKRAIIEKCLFYISILLFLIIFVLPSLSITPRMIATFLSCIAAGVSFVGVMIPSQTYLQEITPGGLRGRVFGNFWFLVTIATILPVVLSGTISEIFGVQFLFAVISALVFTGAMISRRVQNG